MFSVSEVVNPTPVNADRAWKRAISRDTPVYTIAEAAIFVINSPSDTTANIVMIGTKTNRHFLKRVDAQLIIRIQTLLLTFAVIRIYEKRMDMPGVLC